MRTKAEILNEILVANREVSAAHNRYGRFIHTEPLSARDVQPIKLGDIREAHDQLEVAHKRLFDLYEEFQSLP